MGCKDKNKYWFVQIIMLLYFWKISFFSKKSCIFAENFLDDGKV